MNQLSSQKPVPRIQYNLGVGKEFRYCTLEEAREACNKVQTNNSLIKLLKEQLELIPNFEIAAQRFDTRKFLMETLKVKTEVPIKNHDFIIGYWDVVISSDISNFDILSLDDFPLHVHFETFDPIFIECKPQIDSFGATIRQINTYREYLPPWKTPNIVLFSPDLRFKDAFESQGIRVISPNLGGDQS